MPVLPVLLGLPVGVPGLGMQLSEQEMETCREDAALHTGEPPDELSWAEAWNKLVTLAEAAWAKTKKPATMLWALLIGRDVEKLTEVTDDQFLALKGFRIKDRLHWRSDYITFFLEFYTKIEMAPGERFPRSAL